MIGTVRYYLIWATVRLDFLDLHSVKHGDHAFLQLIQGDRSLMVTVGKRLRHNGSGGRI
jgi:hypothetical protein